MSGSSPQGFPEVQAELESALHKVRDAAASFRGGQPVPPLPSLAPSPLIAAGAGAPAAPTTLPFPQAPAPQVAPPPRPQFLRPFWIWGPQEDMPPTERLSTDGFSRIAYETSPEPDVCGGPVWKRVALQLSPGAEAILAQHIGSVSAVNDLAIAHRTIAQGGVSGEYAAALSSNVLTKYKLTDGPRLKVPEKPRPTPAPMPPDGSPVDGNVVVVQHVHCAMLVITSEHHPKFGDTLTQERDGATTFRAEVIRANPKDGGAFDLIVKVLEGEPGAGPLTVRRPVPEPSPAKDRTVPPDPAAAAVMAGPPPTGTPTAHDPHDPK